MVLFSDPEIIFHEVSGIYHYFLSKRLFLCCYANYEGGVLLTKVQLKILSF